MNSRNLINSLVAVAVFSGTTAADVPRLINYQGHLTNSLGNPVTDSTYSVNFTIYGALVGGSSLWSETQSVLTNEGLFAVQLGTLVALPDNLFDDVSRYIGVTVTPDPEIIPRQRLVSTPYSYRVRTVDGATGGVISGDVDIQGELTVSGNVGIGTTSPIERLHVIGDPTFQTIAKFEANNAIFSGIQVNAQNATGNPHLSFTNQGLDKAMLWSSASDGSFNFRIAGTDKIKITSGGNVGIGTTSPAYKLEVSGPVMLENAAVPSASAGHSGVYSSAGELFALDASGNSTQLSPHDTQTGEWIFYSKNIKTGRVVKVNMEKLVRKIEEITGEQFMMESWEEKE